MVTAPAPVPATMPCSLATARRLPPGADRRPSRGHLASCWYGLGESTGQPPARRLRSGQAGARPGFLSGGGGDRQLAGWLALPTGWPRLDGGGETLIGRWPAGPASGTGRPAPAAAPHPVRRPGSRFRAGQPRRTRRAHGTVALAAATGFLVPGSPAMTVEPRRSGWLVLRHVLFFDHGQVREASGLVVVAGQPAAAAAGEIARSAAGTVASEKYVHADMHAGGRKDIFGDFLQSDSRQAGAMGLGWDDTGPTHPGGHGRRRHSCCLGAISRSRREKGPRKPDFL